MSDYTDRLLDASLREYGRVDAPPGFAVRPPRPRAMWAWLLVPAAAAAVALVIALQPTPIAAPAKVVYTMPSPRVVVTPEVKQAHAKVKPAVHYRTLTGEEIAKLEMLPALFAPGAEDKPIVALEIAPLESANPMTESKAESKENQ